MERFKGQVAIITGSGQGIGKGIAKRFAREGAIVVIAEYNPETALAAVQEIEYENGRALAYPIDVSDAPAVRKMVDDVVAKFGHIDILVNNAGVVQTKPMMELTEADWDRIIAVNQRGSFFCLQAVAAQMIKQVPESVRKMAEIPADIMTMKPDELAPVRWSGRSRNKLRQDRQSLLYRRPARPAAGDPLCRQQERHHQHYPIGCPGPGPL